MREQVAVWIKGNYITILLTSLILFIFNFPHLWAYLNIPGGYSFTGSASWFDPWDTNVYLSAVVQAQESGYQHLNNYTTLPHRSFIAYPVYTIFGLFIPNSIKAHNAFPFLTLATGALYALTAFYAISTFLSKPSQKAQAYIPALMGGGFGWLLYQLGPIDIFVPAFTSHAPMTKPHVGVATSFFILSLVSFYRRRKSKKYRDFLLPGLFIAISTRIYPIMLPFYAVVTTLFTLHCATKGNIKKLKEINIANILEILKPTITSTLIGLPVLLYTLFVMFTSESYETVLHQPLHKPSPLNLLAAYGLLGAVFIYQLFKIKKKPKELLFLNYWVLSGLFLSAMPLGAYRYFYHGQFVPISIVFVITSYSLIKNTKTRKLFIYFVIAISIMTSVVIFTMRIRMVYSEPPLKRYYLHQNSENVHAFLNNQPNCTVLTTYTIGNFVPGHTKCSVYYGHDHQTPEGLDKKVIVNEFFGGDFSLSEAKELLNKNNILYVISSEISTENFPREEYHDFLEEEYKSGDMVVWKVVED